MAMSPSPVMALPKGFAELRKSMAQSTHFIPMYVHEIQSFHIPAGTEVCRQGRTLVFKNKKAWDLTVFAGMAWCRGSCSAEVPAVQYKEDLREWWVKETLRHKACSPHCRVLPGPPNLLRQRGRFACYGTASIPCTGPRFPGEAPGEEAGVGFVPL